jgi:hypothetical protein
VSRLTASVAVRLIDAGADPQTGDAERRIPILVGGDLVPESLTLTDALGLVRDRWPHAEVQWIGFSSRSMTDRRQVLRVDANVEEGGTVRRRTYRFPTVTPTLLGRQDQPRDVTAPLIDTQLVTEREYDEADRGTCYVINLADRGGSGTDDGELMLRVYANGTAHAAWRSHAGATWGPPLPVEVRP